MLITRVRRSAAAHRPRRRQCGPQIRKKAEDRCVKPSGPECGHYRLKDSALLEGSRAQRRLIYVASPVPRHEHRGRLS